MSQGQCSIRSGVVTLVLLTIRMRQLGGRLHLTFETFLFARHCLNLFHPLRESGIVPDELDQRTVNPRVPGSSPGGGASRISTKSNANPVNTLRRESLLSAFCVSGPILQGLSQIPAWPRALCFESDFLGSVRNPQGSFRTLIIWTKTL